MKEKERIKITHKLGMMMGLLDQFPSEDLAILVEIIEEKLRSIKEKRGI